MPIEKTGEKIVTIADKKGEAFLRAKTKPFDFGSTSRRDTAALIAAMRTTMREANGIGLSANQIGLNAQVFVAEVPDAHGGLKFYAVFNPVLEKVEGEKVALEEGCLSIPGTYGYVERPKKVILKGFDKNGQLLKIKAWGILARVFQHEVDHLEGRLFIDKAKNVRKDDEKWHEVRHVHKHGT